jgi:hypothetical protein
MARVHATAVQAVVVKEVPFGVAADLDADRQADGEVVFEKVKTADQLEGCRVLRGAGSEVIHPAFVEENARRAVDLAGVFFVPRGHVAPERVAQHAVRSALGDGLLSAAAGPDFETGARGRATLDPAVEHLIQGDPQLPFLTCIGKSKRSSLW